MEATGYVYDELMTSHRNHADISVESPDRIRVPHTHLTSSGILEHCLRIKSRSAQLDELRLIHSDAYIAEVKAYRTSNPYIITDATVPEIHPTYVCDDTYESACVAAGCVLSLMDAICTDKCMNGLAVVRPPGHHAETNNACGFCYFNNIAMATRYIQANYAVTKVLILDWDVHHGNGIQHMFYDDPTVLYISLHRYDDGTYFPGLPEGAVEATGEGKGLGYNVNIAWSGARMGDADYKDAFNDVIYPIVTSYKPDMVLVACGLDAAADDPLGQYHVTSGMYRWMTSKIRAWTNGRMAVILEGGYNPSNMGVCLQEILNELLCTSSDEKLPCHVTSQNSCDDARVVLERVKNAHKAFWDFK